MAATPYGNTAAGAPVQRWTLGGAGGLAADIITYGARLAALRVPGPRGMVSVLLGCPDMAGWEADRAYLGATVGRFAGRVEGARFTLDGTEHRLTANDGTACLHGGTPGFERAIWRAEADGDAVLLRHTSPAGDNGFPGTLDVSVRYAVCNGNALSIAYTATTDAPTVLNLTNHAYFNLLGAGDIFGHELTVAVDSFVPVGLGLIQNAPPLPRRRHAVRLPRATAHRRWPHLGTRTDRGRRRLRPQPADFAGAGARPALDRPAGGRRDRDGLLHHRTVGTALYRQLPRQPAPRRRHAGNPARAERAEPAGICLYRAAAGAGVPVGDGVSVFRIKKNLLFLKKKKQKDFYSFESSAK